MGYPDSVDNPLLVPGPNPWTNGPSTGRPPRWFRPQSYQLLSAGLDRRYGPGGELEIRDGAAVYPGGGRQAEEDNVGLR